MKVKLTKEQQDLVAENHNLIYGFAKYKNLPVDEWYDVLAIGLCVAAKAYDKNIGKFSTLAYTSMNSEVNKVYKKDSRKRRIPKELLVYYDTPIEDVNPDWHDEGSFLQLFDDGQDTCNTVTSKIMLATLIKFLQPKEKAVVELLADGVSVKDIAKQLNCHVQSVYLYIRQIREKWSAYLEGQISLA